MKREVYLLLHNVRSAHNVGSIFRTADAAGVTKLFLTGYTPRPTDRFGRSQPEIAKTALGAEKTVAWESGRSVAAVIKKLQTEGFSVIGLEQNKKSVDYKKYKLPVKAALLVGNEPKGIDARTLALADAIVEIPMRGQKESLNVAVALGIALFRLLNI